MTKNDSENLIKARLLDICRQSREYGTYTYSSFLDLAGISVYKRSLKEFAPVPSSLYGGYEAAEHALVIFGSEEEFGYPPAPPVVLLHIYPSTAKFAEDLSHRDFLGSLMGLGIRRDHLGDLLVNHSECCVFALDTVAGYIQENLTSVKHTLVTVSELGQLPDGFTVHTECFSLVAASFRLDAIASALTKESRSKVLARFRAGEIFLNGIQVTDGSRKCQPGDTLVIRHVGRFTVGEILNETRSERIRLSMERFV